MDVSALKEKARKLAEQYGATVEELLEEWSQESVMPAICMNPECDYFAEYEPDQRQGWCEECKTASVSGLLVLLGVL